MRELLSDITRRIEAQHTSAYFVNGAPGVGKSYLLDELAQLLPDAIPGCVVLPRYEVTGANQFGEAPVLGDQQGQRASKD